MMRELATGAVLMLAAACVSGGGDAPGEGKLVENYSAPGGDLIWTCPDGTALRLDAETSKQSTICLGIDGSECPEPGKPGPGSTECEDPAFNGFKNTCVEDYFSCFQPSGTCEVRDDSNQIWGNGALQDRNYMDFLLAYFPANSTEPCITGSSGSGVVNYQQR